MFSTCLSPKHHASEVNGTNMCAIKEPRSRGYTTTYKESKNLRRQLFKSAESEVLRTFREQVALEVFLDRI